MTACPAPGLRDVEPYDLATARRRRSLEHERVPTPAARGVLRGSGARRCATVPLNRYPDGQMTAPARAVRGARGTRRRRAPGPRTARTRSSPSCCSPTAARVVEWRCSSRRTCCTRAWHGSRRRRWYRLASGRRLLRSRGARSAGRGRRRTRRRLRVLAEQPDGQRAARRGDRASLAAAIGRPGRRRRGLHRVRRRDAR